MKKLHYIDLAPIEKSFDSYEQEIVGIHGLSRRFGGVWAEKMGVWLDMKEQKLCCFNKQNLKKAWQKVHDEFISDSKSMNWYERDKKEIDVIFSRAIQTLN